MNIQTLKGFRDFLPKEARKRQYVLDILKNVFESYGFEPLETPALEYEEILAGKYGDESEKLMYKFRDLGGRNVAMRYDQTVPLARVVAQYQNDIPLPFKRYQIQNVWRAENTQKGRYREFLQVDIDTVGSPSLLSDAEIIAIAIKLFEELGFKNFKVLINDRSVFSSLVADISLPEEKLQVVTRAIDKLEKVGKEKVLEELAPSVGVDTANVILQRINSQKKTKAVYKAISYIKEFGIDEKYLEFDPTLARGLDYYTGLIFEVQIEGYAGGSLGGGGRYDNLIGLFANKTIPAVGFSFGFDRLIEAMDELKLFDGKDLGGVKILVTNTSGQSFEVTEKLREQGINAELYADEKDLDKQLKYADKKGIPYVLIFDNDKLILKDMTSGEQKELEDLAKLIDELSAG
ncbi:MAG: Histidyl-tRNA synthetase [Candidatus Levybacteria bacterium GW2011_GWA2_40_8]|nr:MAG: Histidyl-tRNA synthetase [Candidatus Levybacteria bacterium GW2011_GWA2_40_8]